MARDGFGNEGRVHIQPGAVSHGRSSNLHEQVIGGWWCPEGVVLDQSTHSLGLGLSILKMKNRARWSLGISLNPKPLLGTDGEWAC